MKACCVYFEAGAECLNVRVIKCKGKLTFLLSFMKVINSIVFRRVTE